MMELSPPDSTMTAAQFQRELFRTNGNLLAIIDLHDNSCENLQTIQTFHKLNKYYAEALYQNAVLLGAAHYSYINNSSIGIIARHSLILRSITLDEIVLDTRNCFNDVKGNKLTEQEKKTGDFSILYYEDGNFYHYQSTPRLIKTVVTTKSIEGNLPENINPTLEELEKIEPKDKSIAFQMNHVWYCNKGQIYALTFDKPEQYSLNKLNHEGQVIQNQEGIWFDWPGSKFAFNISELSHTKTN